MKIVRLFYFALIATFVATGSAATEVAGIACERSTQPTVCAAMQKRAAKARALASAGRQEWAKVAHLLIENAPAPYVQLPDGTVLDIYSGDQRKTVISVGASRDEKRASERLVSEWGFYVQTVLEHHRRGVLTYDMYPCTDVCEGHRLGFEWAEKNSFREYRECVGESRSFVEGCTIWVTRRKGRALPVKQ